MNLVLGGSVDDGCLRLRFRKISRVSPHCMGAESKKEVKGLLVCWQKMSMLKDVEEVPIPCKETILASLSKRFGR